MRSHMPRPARLTLLLLAALSCGPADADEVLHYQCSTVMNYGPSPCRGAVPPAQDEAALDLDPQHHLWRSSHNSGVLDSNASTFTLKQWGLRPGRDATLDRASGAFAYHFESGCLVQHQTGSCQPRQP